MSSQVKTVKSEQKSRLRFDLLQQVRNASTTEKKQWSDRIQESLKALLSKQSGYWGAFQALSDEPQIRWAEVSDRIQWCFPCALENDLQFRFGARSHQRSALGVSEPVDGAVISLDQLHGVVVPGVGFSQKGHRLGRGKGYYDRSLQSFSGKKVGVCFSLSLKAEIPHEEHDVLVHQIVTENSVYQVDYSEGDIKWN